MGTIDISTKCSGSPAGSHYHILPAEVPRVERVLRELRVVCDYCGQTCKMSGALWAVECFTIAEEEHIEDYV